MASRAWRQLPVVFTWAVLARGTRAAHGGPPTSLYFSCAGESGGLRRAGVARLDTMDGREQQLLPEPLPADGGVHLGADRRLSCEFPGVCVAPRTRVSREPPSPAPLAMSVSQDLGSVAKLNVMCNPSKLNFLMLSPAFGLDKDCHLPNMCRHIFRNTIYGKGGEVALVVTGDERGQPVSGGKIADGGIACFPRAGFSGKVSDSDLAKVQNCIPNAVRGVRARGCGKNNKGALSCLRAAGRARRCFLAPVFFLALLPS